MSLLWRFAGLYRLTLFDTAYFSFIGRTWLLATRENKFFQTIDTQYSARHFSSLACHGLLSLAFPAHSNISSSKAYMGEMALPILDGGTIPLAVQLPLNFPRVRRTLAAPSISQSYVPSLL